MQTLHVFIIYNLNIICPFIYFKPIICHKKKIIHPNLFFVNFINSTFLVIFC